MRCSNWWNVRCSTLLRMPDGGEVNQQIDNIDVFFMQARLRCSISNSLKVTCNWIVAAATTAAVAAVYEVALYLQTASVHTLLLLIYLLLQNMQFSWFIGPFSIASITQRFAFGNSLENSLAGTRAINQANIGLRPILFCLHKNSVFE